jgi:transcriptional regulator with XRE-family HTH domain
MPGKEYTKAVGSRLRRIRLQKGMSLQDLQASSGGVWKGAVVGAYERGDRNVTVSRLSELADFYGVPVSEILPEDQAPAPVEERRRIALDLTSLERLPEAERDPLKRFAATIQVQRGDFNGRVLTVREDDLMALALLYKTGLEDMANRLESWGLMA